MVNGSEWVIIPKKSPSSTGCDLMMFSLPGVMCHCQVTSGKETLTETIGKHVDLTKLTIYIADLADHCHGSKAWESGPPVIAQLVNTNPRTMRF